MTASKILLATFCLLALAACGKRSVSVDTLVNAPAGVAIKGYDPVAYHLQGKPVKGSAAHQAIYQNTTYHFSTSHNQQTFEAAPEKYIPAYGGYCAYAMSTGSVVDINPKNWAIVDGQLYLNANFFAQSLWSIDKPRRISRADRHWSRLKVEATGLSNPMSAQY